MAFPVIDSHQHVWDPARAEYAWLGPELAPINRAFGMDELLPELAAAGVDATVLVQAADNADDTALMVATADAHPEVAAIVGYAPLERPAEVAETLARWQGASRMVGVRTLIHNQSDPEWLLRPDVDEGLGLLEGAGIAFDVVAELPRHLELIPVLSERHPGLRMVIDHLAKPPIGLADREPWWSLIAAAAENPNVSGKLSGLYSATGAPDAWTTEQVRPFFDRAVELFGPSRLMYGGDWPVAILSGGYTRLWEGLAPLLDSLSSEDRERVLGRTAADFYRIDPARLDR